MEHEIHTSCCYCGRHFDERLEKTKDHFIPISRGGKDGVNIMYACWPCNKWKADLMPNTWLLEVERSLKRKRLIRGYEFKHYELIIGHLKKWIKKFRNNKNISYYKF